MKINDILMPYSTFRDKKKARSVYLYLVRAIVFNRGWEGERNRKCLIQRDWDEDFSTLKWG